MPEDADNHSPESQPEASSPANSTPSPVRKRRRFGRRILQLFLILLLLAAIFHRPLLHTGLRLALIEVAARQNVKLDVDFSGSIFTNLVLQNVRAYPTGAAPSPVEKITIESVRLDYSIPMLVRHGLSEFLRSYEIKNADLRLLAFPSEDEEEKRQKRSLARDLNNLLAQPALYADRVRVENFNIRVEAPDNVTEVQGFDLFAHPEQLGYLRVDRLKIPGLPVWENLSAETSYAQRNLYIRGLRLDEQLAINELNFDASQRAQKRGSIILKASAFGGTIQARLQGAQLAKPGENLESSYETDLDLEASNVDLTAATAYFGPEPVPIGVLKNLKLDVTGEPERPRTWTGFVSTTLSPPAGKLPAETISLMAKLDDGTAHITSGNADLGKGSISFTGTAQLPETVNALGKTEGDAKFQFDLPDLREITTSFRPQQPIAGSATGQGTLSVRDQQASGKVTLEARRLASKELSAGNVKVQADFSTPVGKPDQSPIKNFKSDVSASGTDLQFGTVKADSATVEGEVRDGGVRVKSGELIRGQNRMKLKGTYNIPQALLNLPRTLPPIDTELDFNIPDLASLGIQVKGETLAGSLTAQGSLRTVNKELQGEIDIKGSALSLGDFVAERLAGKITIANDVATIEELRLQIKGAANQVALTGKIGLNKPLPYEGAVLFLLKDMSVLQPLLAIFGVEEPVSGSLDLSIEGNGQLDPQMHEGEFRLAVDNGRFGEIDLKQVRLAGLYGPEFFESTELRLVSGNIALTGSLEWRDQKLRLRDIDLKQGTQQVLSGYAIIPFEPTSPGPLVPLDKRIAANLNIRELDIERLLASFGIKSPVTGTLTANLIAGGTFLKPTANLKIAARGVKSPTAPKFPGADIRLAANYADEELLLDAEAKLPDLQPLTIRGRLPLDLEATLQEKRLDPDLPLDLTVRLPRTSLAFLPKLVPAVQRIDGSVAIDARIAGTVANPRFSGSASARIDLVRIEGEGIPAIGRLAVDIAFTDQGLRIRTFRGEVAGGTFSLAGSVLVPRWFEPVFDLRLLSDDVLVRRDDAVTVRVDTDIRASGPLEQGAITGTVWVTQSRFFRDIDILPIGLPGRPKPRAPKSAPATGTFSIDQPPFSNWLFNVAIKTRPGDPFLIRGNLASGSALIDLRLGGSGEAPYLEGLIRVDNFVASLPFSRLNVTRGFITFSRDAPFEPQLDIQAESQIRDYRITANVYGSARDPQLSLSSEPPLPQQDIISLLATGTTTSELTGSPEILAGRAAVLLFQELSRKLFKNRGPTENIPILDRFKLDIGAVDNRTGRQELSASFKLGENFYLVGDVDVTGEFTGRIRYLVRFR